MKLKHRVKRKRKLEGFRLDFITALTPEECWSRLEARAAQPSEQRLSEFYLEERHRLPMWFRIGSIGGYYYVRFDGTLQTVPTGTWVRGHIASSTRRRLRVEELLRDLCIGYLVYMLLLGVRAVISGSTISVEGAGTPFLLFAFLLSLFAWRGRIINANAQNLVNWIHDQLSPFIVSESTLEDIYPAADGRDTDAERDRLLTDRFNLLNEHDALVMALIKIAIFLSALLCVLDSAS